MEEWRDVRGYEGVYKVSSLGRIKSIGNNQARKEKILKGNINSKGYLFVTLCLQGCRKQRTIHQVVAMTFLNHNPNGHKVVVDHVDNNKTNNSIYNLQVITARLNVSKDRLDKTSKYTGVCWHKAGRKWYAQIRIEGKTKYLGSYKSEFRAHLAYQNILIDLV